MTCRSLILALGLLPLVSEACYQPPPWLFQPHAELVAKASSILLVKINVGQGAQQPCQFSVVQALKGTAPAMLPFTCRLPGQGDWMTHFATHSDPDFWSSQSGRLGIESDCSLVPPAFEIGHTYLVVLGADPDTKQFEDVGGINDLWLSFVKAQIAHPQLKKR